MFKKSTILFKNEVLYHKIVYFFLLFGTLSMAQNVYMDKFTTSAYNNNYGTANFSTNWTENDANGGGATGGNIDVSGGKLVFDRLASSDNVYRRLNLAGVTKQVTLSFDYDATSRGWERLVVQLWSTASNNWQTISTIQTNTADTFTYTLTNSHKSNQSGIRFYTNSGNWDTGDMITIDNVSFQVDDQPPVITATGDQAYCPGTSIPVVESISISDPDDPLITEVSVQISSGYIDGEDVLALTGSHPNVTASFLATEGRLLLTGPASATDFEAAVAAVTYSSSALNPIGTRDFSIIVGDAYFLPDSGHYYQFYSDVGITWTDARDKAALLKYYGLQGYLATLTSAAESSFAGSQISGAGWIGGSDEAVEGVWRWVTGPEAGTIFWNGTAGGSSPNYAFWNTGEPNQSGNEDYAHITEAGTGIDGSWNDLTNAGAGSGAYQPKGYVVEFGGTTGDPAINVSASTTITIIGNPTITTQPVDQTAGVGGDATFSVTASGTSLNYQWQVSTNAGASYNDISGATGSSVLVSSVSLADDGNLYRVQIDDSGCAAIVSAFAELIILADADNDGYADVDDLDDDNDGILDSVELASCAGTLQYEFYDLVPSGNTVDNIPTSGAYSIGSVSSFDVDALQAAVDPGDSDSFAIRFTGLISITAGGTYTFYTNSDDGSKVFINGSEIVDNDGNHGTQERSGTVSLTPGLHNIEVLFYEDGGGESLVVQYSGPSLFKQDIPFTVLYESSCDQDGDGLANHLDPDSDNDGCNDADEAYGDPATDVDDNGAYGSGSPAVNSDGTVQAASYATPADGNSNGIYDFLEMGSAAAIGLQPLDITLCPGCTGTMSVTATNADNYQWQYYNGSVWMDLTDTGIYSGTNTTTLTLSKVQSSNNGTSYRVIATNNGFSCSADTSNTSLLTVSVSTVITNRRITHRVDKN